jgi:hypothetical protein
MCNEWVNVKTLSSNLRQQFLHQDLTLFTKNFDKDVKNFEMESWGDHLPV